MQLQSEEEVKGKPEMMTIENTTGGVIDGWYAEHNGLYAEQNSPWNRWNEYLVVRYLDDHHQNPCRGSKWPPASHSYGSMQVHNINVQRHVLDSDVLTGFNSSLWRLQNAFPVPQALGEAMFSIFWTSA